MSTRHAVSVWNLPVIDTLQPHRAAGGFIKTIKQAEEGGLASAARPNDHQNFSFTHIDSHVIDDARASNLAAEMVGSEDGGQWRERLLLY